MTIVPMNSSHVAAVAELEKQCFSDPWSEKSIASELENELATWLVCLEDGKTLGYVGSQTVLGETDMMNVAVHPDFRNQGIARGLIGELINVLSSQGSRSLTLEVRASNTPARNLYQTLGFWEVGCRKNYYRNPKEDGLILRKEWEI